MPSARPARVVILGAGFAGLELATSLSEGLGEGVAVTLIDRSPAFVFGFSKLDLLFGRASPQAVRHSYGDLDKPGVTLRRETVLSIDPTNRRVTTDAGTHDADVLVIALGADYDATATPGLVLGRDEFYSVAGAEHLATLLPAFTRGNAVIGVCGAPYKCPPAPSECALMLHDFLAARGVRGHCGITLVNPLPSPVPPSPDTSKALVEAFAERGIEYLPGRRIAQVDASTQTVTLDDGRALPCQLFLGVPKHRAPEVVLASGLAQDGWVPVDARTLETRVPGVYAVGDLANTGTPKAGVFAESAARVVAANLIARLRGQQPDARNPGAGSCYIEFGANRVARVDVDFFSGPRPTGTFHAPSEALRVSKEHFGSSRRARWFGR